MMVEAFQTLGLEPIREPRRAWPMTRSYQRLPPWDELQALALTSVAPLGSGRARPGALAWETWEFKPVGPVHATGPVSVGDLIGPLSGAESVGGARPATGDMYSPLAFPLVTSGMALAVGVALGFATSGLIVGVGTFVVTVSIMRNESGSELLARIAELLKPPAARHPVGLPASPLSRLLHEPGLGTSGAVVDDPFVCPCCGRRVDYYFCPFDGTLFSANPPVRESVLRAPRSPLEIQVAEHDADFSRLLHEHPGLRVRRTPALNRKQIGVARTMCSSGEYTMQQIADHLAVSPSTIYGWALDENSVSRGARLLVP